MTAAQHELVLYSRDEHVVTITLNRSEKRNAFNAELVKALSLHCFGLRPMMMHSSPF